MRPAVPGIPYLALALLLGASPSLANFDAAPALPSNGNRPAVIYTTLPNVVESAPFAGLTADRSAQAREAANRPLSADKRMELRDQKCVNKTLMEIKLKETAARIAARSPQGNLWEKQLKRLAGSLERQIDRYSLDPTKTKAQVYGAEGKDFDRLNAEVKRLNEAAGSLRNNPASEKLIKDAIKAHRNASAAHLEIRDRVNARVLEYKNLKKTAGNRTMAVQVLNHGVEGALDRAIKNRQVNIDVNRFYIDLPGGNFTKMYKMNAQLRDRWQKEISSLEKTLASYRQMRSAYGGQQGWEKSNDRVKNARNQAIKLLGAAHQALSSNMQLHGAPKNVTQKERAKLEKNRAKAFERMESRTKSYEKAAAKAAKPAPRPKPKPKGK